MKRIIIATILLTSPILRVKSSKVNVKMKHEDFQSILSRECASELEQLPAGQDQVIWSRLTYKQWWAPPFKCEPGTFIICDSSEAAGHQKFINIENTLSRYVIDLEKEQISIDKYPIMNDETTSCFLVSTSKEAAKRMNKNDCRDKKPCMVQPLLPMMKIQEGTVEGSESIESKGSRNDIVKIMLQLSPYLLEDFPMESILEDLGLRTEQECRSQLEEALPYSEGLVISCDTSKINDRIGFDQYRDTVELEIYFRKDLSQGREHDLELTQDMLLSLITGLASRPEIAAVGIDGGIHSI
jgi:hypothetical protein